MPPSGIEKFKAAELVKENVHRNFKHFFKPDHSYTIKNIGTGLSAYNRSTRNIQWLIQNAIDNNMRLRAMGSNWALAPVASSDSMLNTNHLTLRFNLVDSSVSNTYKQNGKDPDDLFFVQCGNLVWSINKIIETQKQRSLKASGGSNGQTIAGATSTGTHGGGLYTGSVHDSIVGLHIVTGGDTHVWIERASYPVVSDSFVQKLGATIIRDDSIFNSAVVSFGSFGIIHGILLETEPRFLLEEHQFRSVPYTSELKDAITTLDINKLRNLIPALPQETPTNKLYHLEMLINLNKFRKDPNDSGINIQAFYKQPCPAEYVPEHNYTKSTAAYSKDTLGMVSTILDTVGPHVQNAVIRPLVNALFESGIRPPTHSPKTIGETFTFTRFRGQVASAAHAVDISNVFRALEAIAEINESHPLAGAVALRFVKGTPATLGFTKFNNTVVMEMDGIDGDVTRDFFRKAWTKLEALSIPYTLHWGKFNFILNPQRVRNMYGEVKVNEWLQNRATLLTPQARHVFSNDFMIQCGLFNTDMPPFVPTDVIV